MKLKRILIALALLIITLSIQSCNEKPTDVGFSLLYDTVSVKISDSFKDSILKSHEALNNKIIIFNGGCSYVGKSDSLYAIGILSFIIPDTLGYLTEADILDSYMTLQPNRYSFGDTISNNLVFNVYKITKYWTTHTIADSIFDLDKDNYQSSYWESQSRGKYSEPIKLSDVMNPLKVNIDASLVVDWFKTKVDTASRIWGVALVPESGSNVIHQFSGQAITTATDLVIPTVTVIYKSKYNKNDTIVMKSGIDASIVARKKTFPNDRMIVQGGTTVKTRLNFDFTQIPTDAGVLYSQLELTLDRKNVLKGNIIMDSIITGAIYPTASLDTVPYDQFYAAQQSNSDKFIFKNINPIIEKIIRNTRTGNIVLSAYGWSETRKLDQLSFYGINDPDTNKRPKLKIVYTSRLKK